MASNQSLLQTPPPKRIKLEEARSVHVLESENGSGSESISERVLRLSDEIRKYLNVKEVVNKTLLSDCLDFLRKKEHKHVLKLRKNNRPSCDIIDNILFALKLRDQSTKDEDCRRFVACIVKAATAKHPGHWDLVKRFKRTLEYKDLQQIQEILDKVKLPSFPSPCTSPLYSLVPFYQQVDTLEEESSVESENVSYSSGSDSISERVLRLSDEIRKYLNVKEVVNQTLLSDDIDFLRKKEHKHVLKLRKNNRPSCDIIDHILFALKLRDQPTKDEDCRRFVACIVKAFEHPGHWDLAYIFSHMLECKDLENIQEILGKVQLPPLPSPCTSPPLSPILIRRATIEFSRLEKPVPLITL